MKKGGLKISNDTRDSVIVGLSFVFGTFCLALNYNLFFLPNNFVVGGTSGLGIIIERLTGFSAQTFIYVSAFILLIVCYVLLGKEETKKVVVGSLLYPLFVTFTAPIANFLIQFLTFKEILATVILASLFYGFSNGLIYKYGYSTGGSDIIVKVMCKYLHFSEGKSLIILNIFIIIAGGFVFGVDNALYAVIILVISSLIVDKISIGISNSKKFMIYTRRHNRIKELIEDEFKAGYTVYPTIGGYSHINGKMIMCVIRNRDVTFFKTRILEIDPTAFFVISDCYEVEGGIRRSNLPFM